MKLNCTNFGPIKQGSIDLNKDLLILCGKNSTGKSYLSYLLYGLYKGDFKPGNVEHFISIEDVTLKDALNGSDILEASFSVNLAVLTRTKAHEIEEELGKLIKGRLLEVFPNTNNFENTSFRISLPLTTESQSREFENGHRGSISINDESNVSINDEVNKGIDVVHVTFTKNPRQHKVEFIASHTNKLKTLDLTKEIIDLVHSIILTIIFVDSNGEKLNEPYFFPAERIALDVFSWDVIQGRTELGNDVGVQHTFEYIFNSPAGQKSSISNIYRPRHIDTDKFYPLPIRDFILRSSSYGFHTNNKGEFFDLGRELEGYVGIEVSMQDSKTIGIGNKEMSNVPIKLASSTLKSLSSFIIYLKHQAKQKHIVFFDEPELSLHPSLQRKVAVILAKMVKRGMKVVISTHSDFILREFNNLIMLHQDTAAAKKLRIKYENVGYNIRATLNPQRVGVSILGNGTIKEVPVELTGFDVGVIDDVIINQNEIAEDIYFSLF